MELFIDIGIWFEITFKWDNWQCSCYQKNGSFKIKIDLIILKTSKIAYLFKVV